MTSFDLSAPAALTRDHTLADFDSGTAELDDWLKRLALKNEVHGASRTFVVAVGNRVVGYYCLSTGAIVRAASPKPMQRNMPDPIPVVVMGRLAVDVAHQGHGIGSALVRDAILRVLHAAESIGIKALLVHALSDDAKRFYLDRGFVASPTAPMTVCLVLDTARSGLTS